MTSRQEARDAVDEWLLEGSPVTELDEAAVYDSNEAAMRLAANL